MIKINLLPVPKARKVKKAAEVQYELVLGGIVIGGVVAVCIYFWFLLDSKISRLQQDRSRATAELTVLKEKVKEVDNYENNKKILEEKNRIIEQLKKNQTIPVRLLDEVSRSLEPLKIWLVSMAAQESKIDIDGRAITNSDIVELINLLRNTKMFSDIQLIESRQAVELNIPVYNFKLRCTMVL